MRKTLLAYNKGAGTTDELTIILKYTEGWENALTVS